jgi:hypothetical protein
MASEVMPEQQDRKDSRCWNSSSRMEELWGWPWVGEKTAESERRKVNWKTKRSSDSKLKPKSLSPDCRRLKIGRLTERQRIWRGGMREGLA